MIKAWSEPCSRRWVKTLNVSREPLFFWRTPLKVRVFYVCVLWCLPRLSWDVESRTTRPRRDSHPLCSEPRWCGFCLLPIWVFDSCLSVRLCGIFFSSFLFCEIRYSLLPALEVFVRMYMRVLSPEWWSLMTICRVWKSLCWHLTASLKSICIVYLKENYQNNT